MNVKQLKEFLSKIPDEAVVYVELEEAEKADHIDVSCNYGKSFGSAEDIDFSKISAIMIG